MGRALAVVILLIACTAAAATAQAPFDYASTTDITGTAPVSGFGREVAVRGDLACLATSSDLVCLDVTDPHAPLVLGQAPHTMNCCELLWLSDTCVVLVAIDGQVRTFDVADPAAPVSLGSHHMAGTVTAAAVTGDLLVLVRTSDLRFVDLVDPAAPTDAGTAFTGTAFNGIDVLADPVVLLTGEDAILEVDLAVPTSPVILQTHTPRYLPWYVMYEDVLVVDDRVWVTADQALPVAPGKADGPQRQNPYLVMVFDPTVPGDESLIGYWEYFGSGVALHGAAGGLVYGSYGDLLLIFDTAADVPNLHALEPVLCLDLGTPVRDVAGGDHTVGIATSESEFAALPLGEAGGVPAAARFGRGHHGGFVSERWAYSHTVGDLYYHTSYKYYLWDLADPLNPVRRDSVNCYEGFEFSLDVTAIAARDTVVISRARGSGEHYLYVDVYGATVEDFTSLGEAYDDALFIGDLLVNHGYDNSWDEGVRVYDLSDPLQPVMLADLPDPTLNWVFALTDQHGLTRHNDAGERYLRRLDLHDPDQIQMTGHVTVPSNVTRVAAAGDLALVGDYDGNVLVIDHTAMTLLGTLELADSGSVVGLAVDGPRAWVCWSDAGIAVVDLTDPVAPSLTGPVVALPGKARHMYRNPWTAGVYVACDLAGLQLVVENRACQPVLVGGGGVRAGGVGPTGGWLHTYGAILPPAVLMPTAAPVTPPPAAGAIRAVPNPFNPQTVIHYAVPAPGPVDLAIFDLRGRLVRTLRQDARATAGEATARWDGRDDDGRAAATGIYLVRLRTAAGITGGRLCLIR